MLPLTDEQVFALARVLFCVLAIGGIIGAVLAWWKDMKGRGP